jgi:hypothetical protein
LTFDRLTFDLIGVTKDGLNYIALSRFVKKEEVFNFSIIE